MNRHCNGSSPLLFEIRVEKSAGLKGFQWLSVVTLVRLSRTMKACLPLPRFSSPTLKRFYLPQKTRFLLKRIYTTLAHPVESAC